MTRFVLFAFLILSYATTSFAKDVIKIGLSSNFSELSTVSFNPFGGYFRDAINLAIEDNKASLEKADIELQLKEFDYGVNDVNVIKAVDDAEKSNMLAVIGYNYSSSALMAAPIHVKDKLPMISPSASADRLGTFGKYVHLGSINNEFMAKTLAKIATRNLKLKKILIVTAVNCAYCMDLGDVFTAELKKQSGETVKTISVIQEDTDFTKAAQEAKNLKFDAVFIPTQELTAARIIAAFTAASINKPFLGADGWGNEGTEFFRVLKGKKFTGYSVTHWHPQLKSKKSEKFVSDYLKHFHKMPNDTSALAYDSMTSLIRTLIKIKPTSRESLEAALNSVESFEGVTGKAYFFHNKAPQKDIILLKTTDSSFVIDQLIPCVKGEFL